MVGLRLLDAVNRARYRAVMAWGDVGGIPDGSPESVELGKAERALDEFDARHGYHRRAGGAGHVYQHGEHYRPPPTRTAEEREAALTRQLRDFVRLVEDVDGWMIGQDPPPFGWSESGTLTIAKLGVELGFLYVIPDTSDIYATTDEGRAWLAKGAA